MNSISGPYGSFLSSVAYVLSVLEGFDVTGGEVLYLGKNLLEMAPEQRARGGGGRAGRGPGEGPGGSNVYVLKAAVNAVR